MKKFISIILILSLISLISCTDQSAKIYSENMGSAQQESDTESEEDSDDTNNVLVISSDLIPQEFAGFGPLVEGFEKLHPDVEIIINDTGVDMMALTPDETTLAFNKYMDDLSVKMLAGEAPDLIFSTGDFNNDFAFSGLLYDLNEFIENDETFIKEDFFMEVLKAWEVAGGLHSMPTTFEFSSVRFRQDVLDGVGISLDEIESADYKFLFDTYYTVLDSGLFPEITHLGREQYVGKGILALEEISNAFDKETMTVNFEGEEFLDYLNTTLNYEAGQYPFGSFMMAGADTLFEREEYLAEGSGSYTDDADCLVSEKDNASKAIPLTTSGGELLVKGNNLSIPKDAKNPELAWEFIKYCIYESETVSIAFDAIGEWDGDRFFNSIPINRNNFKKICDAYSIGDLQTVYMTEYHDYVIKSLELPIATRMPSNILVKELNNLQTDFYNGLMTAEECAKAMQDRAEIYFAEIE